MNDDIEITEYCDHILCPELPDSISIDAKTWDDIQELYYHFFPDEFAVYLKGFVSDGVVYINDYVVPFQKVFPGFVEITDLAPPDVIGHLHSHGYIKPFFSGTDLDHLNYGVHVVIGAGSPVGVVRGRMSCGNTMQKSVRVIVEEI